MSSTTPPTSAHTASITASGLTFAWPDGDVVFDNLSLVVPPGRSGLVGSNDTGKSTLLKLIGGALRPSAGSTTTAGEVGYLPQDLALRAAQPVTEFLGIGPVLAAIAAVTSGDASPEYFDTIGDAWDIEERAEAQLARLGLPAGVLHRRLGELSGGETVQLGLTRLFLQGPDVLLLDEPTNNLDRVARQRLYETVAAFRGALLVVSHDRDLLERVDQIGDLRDGSVTWYGGGFTAYREQVEVEQEAAAQAVRTAKADVRKQQRELVETQTKLDRRKRYGKKMQQQGRVPPIVAGNLKRAAQVSAARLTDQHTGDVARARERLDRAESRLREDAEIRVDLPGSRVPAGRDVLVLTDLVLRHGRTVDLHLRGPGRVALTGPNGSGKTTLLHTITGDIPPRSGTVDLRVPSRLLPQRLDVLDDELSLVANLARFAPQAETNALRAALARFRIRGGDAERTVSTLSGGERFRATLAALLLAEPTPQLLVLDEPTNNLDLLSVEQLVSALSQYRGALLVASHDERFLAEIGITRTFDLGQETGDV